MPNIPMPIETVHVRTEDGFEARDESYRIKVTAKVYRYGILTRMWRNLRDKPTEYVERHMQLVRERDGFEVTHNQENANDVSYEEQKDELLAAGEIRMSNRETAKQIADKDTQDE